jgi:hypothetical protein
MPKITFKAFNKDLTCRDFQFEIGQTYTHTGEVKACASGFHSCENPLDILNYYNLTTSRFAQCTVDGVIKTHEDDSKIASSIITINKELSLTDLINAAIIYQKDNASSGQNIQLASSGDYSKLASSGNSSTLASSGQYSKLASSGDYSQLASSGDYSQLASSGDYSKLASSGHYSKLASSGDCSKLASSGDDSKLASSGHDSQLASSGPSSTLASSGHYSKLASSGQYSKLASSGHDSQLASSGHDSQLASSGQYSKLSVEDNSIAGCMGVNGRVKGGANCELILTYYTKESGYRSIIAHTGENGIKVDVWYRLDGNHKFVECD